MFRLLISILLLAHVAHAQPGFYTEYAYQPGIEHGNPKFNDRFRVNGPAVTLHEVFGGRSEVRGNGMMQIRVDEDPRSIETTTLSLELWGGHPGTSHKRVTINGRSTCDIPEVGTAAHQCTHQHPTFRLNPTDWVHGYNALQFACNDEHTFWGHFIVENATIRTYLPENDKRLANLQNFSAIIQSSWKKSTEEIALTLESSHAGQIESVLWQGFYHGYDENGNAKQLDWHGFMKEDQPIGFLGESHKEPFEVKWDVSMLSVQPVMKVRAWIRFHSGTTLNYLTEATPVAVPSSLGERVAFHAPDQIPVPFWSRDNQMRTCSIHLPMDPSQIERAELHTVVWDGGVHHVDEYFTLNEHFLPIADEGHHDTLYRVTAVDPAQLQSGKNTIRLLSDTEHHGIEMLLPGPVLVVKRKSASPPLPLDKWTYIEVDRDRGKWGDWDEPAWLRYFGLAMRDLNGDEQLDIASGRYVYLNPGGDLSAEWSRIDLGQNVDAILAMDVDGDSFADVIAQALPNLYWFEADNAEATEWTAHRFGQIPATEHVNSQGFGLGQIIPGGKKEIIVAGHDGIHSFQIPENPETGPWPSVHITDQAADEGLCAADLDGDGWVDIAAGRMAEYLAWWKNPGTGEGNWQRHIIGNTPHDVDRVEVGDLNADGRPDVIITEERYPGPDPDANLFWFEQPENPNEEWPRHTVVTQHSMNNLDTYDMDGDGDLDLITAEHKGPNLELQVWQNDGRGSFTRHLIDQGKESHLGTQVADLDQDGDPDIISIGWDQYRFLHIWRNDAVKK